MSTDANLSLGQFLRQEREKRGLTLEQVASATKISVRVLQSLESDQYAELPARPFIRGFASSYARFIGMDAQEVLTRFDAYIEAKSKDRPSREGGHSGYAFEKREGEQSRTFLWIVMGSFVLLGTVAFLVFKPSLKHRKQTHADKLRAVAQPSPSPSAGVVVAGASPAPSAIPSAQPSIVALNTSPSPKASPSAKASPSPSPAPSPVASLVAKPAAPVPSPLPLPKTPLVFVLKPSAQPAPVSSSSPAVALAPGASPSPSPSEKPDTLNSGVNLKPAEIKYKLIFKALADVRVRYRVDERPMMKFILRKDRILVLRAQKVVHFQVSNPEGVNFQLNGSAEKLVSQAATYAVRSGVGTLVFPGNSPETNANIFSNEGALSDPPPAP